MSDVPLTRTSPPADEAVADRRNGFAEEVAAAEQLAIAARPSETAIESARALRRLGERLRRVGPRWNSWRSTSRRRDLQPQCGSLSVGKCHALLLRVAITHRTLATLVVEEHQ
jgi:hypothetical protein